MYKYRRTDFVETDLKPALVEACSHQMALIDGSLSQFTRHRDRLKVVREQKRKQKLELELIGRLCRLYWVFIMPLPNVWWPEA